jgi:hypothetical protein
MDISILVGVNTELWDRTRIFADHFSLERDIHLLC